MIFCRLMQDRRRSDRPANGDKRICPACRAYSIEFNERYRLPDSRGAVAAWVCDAPRCGFAQPARQGDRRLFDKRRMVSMRLPVRTAATARRMRGHRKKTG